MAISSLIELLGGQPLRHPRHVHRKVADRFQLRDHVERAHDLPQIGSHRLLGGQQPQAGVVDLVVHAVDGVLVAQCQFRTLHVVLRQRAHRAAYPTLHLLPHGGERLAQLVEGLAELGAQWRRHVAPP